MTVAKISEKVYLLDPVALGYAATVAVYVIKAPKITLVDCGYASSYKSVLKELADLGIRPSDVRYLIPTHVHLDHAGAAGYLAKEMPNAQVLAQEKAVRHLVDPSKLIESATSIFGEETMKTYGLPIPIENERITPIGEEMHIELGDGLSATALHTPGHAPHQVSVLLEEEKLLFTADAVGIVYPKLQAMIPTTPPPSFEPEKLVRTVDQLEQVGSNSLLIPHFGLRNDVLNVFETTKDRVNSWLAQVRNMRNKNMSIDEIARELQNDVARRAKIKTQELPVYARSSIRVSTMGIIHYLERSKPLS